VAIRNLPPEERTKAKEAKSGKAEKKAEAKPPEKKGEANPAAKTETEASKPAK
jgi:hypothetical protein